MTGELLYEAQDRIARITINRPDRRNAINPDVVTGIAEGIRTAEAADDINVIVLTGSGDRAFCAGGDLGGGTLESGKVAAHFSRSEIGALFQQMRESPLPIVARVNGHALAGGFGLMLACDLVVAAREAELGTPEVNIGLWPFMISAIIRRDVPRKVALDLMLTGRRIAAEEGARWGFVNEVVDRDSLDKAVDELTSILLEKSPLIVGLGKTSFYRAEDMRLADALDYLAGMLTICLESEDTIEGVTAFLQKRNPEWKGR
jgi:enoyl-CoA hydratase/carnithine racemase